MTHGDHVWVRRLGYSHHGVDCGDGTVVHFNGEPGRGKVGAKVTRTPMDVFLDGGELRVQPYGQRLTAEETVEAAESQLGAGEYHLMFNNCEHFARWCCTGQKNSHQVRNVTSGTAITTAVVAAPTVAIATVSGMGAAAGLSGAGVMSGLATTGAFVGGGAAAGPVALAVLPVAVMTGVVHYALEDDESLAGDERAARRDGRGASKAAAIASVAAVPVVLSAAGTAGLSAVGISTGLATIGAVVGGGMAAGVGVLVAGPVVLVGVAGLGTYFLGRSVRRAFGSDPSASSETGSSTGVVEDPLPAVITSTHWHRAAPATSDTNVAGPTQ